MIFISFEKLPHPWWRRLNTFIPCLSNTTEKLSPSPYTHLRSTQSDWPLSTIQSNHPTKPLRELSFSKIPSTGGFATNSHPPILNFNTNKHTQHAHIQNTPNKFVAHSNPAKEIIESKKLKSRIPLIYQMPFYQPYYKVGCSTRTPNKDVKHTHTQALAQGLHHIYDGKGVVWFRGVACWSSDRIKYQYVLERTISHTHSVRQRFALNAHTIYILMRGSPSPHTLLHYLTQEKVWLILKPWFPASHTHTVVVVVAFAPLSAAVAGFWLPRRKDAWRRRLKTMM